MEERIFDRWGKEAEADEKERGCLCFVCHVLLYTKHPSSNIVIVVDDDDKYESINSKKAP